MFDIQQELKKLPAKPGVYLMHNSKDEIIYVGKAIKLCNRVRQYFQDSRNLSVKIQHMVKNVAYFEYIITDSELEALVLENNLPCQHDPWKFFIDRYFNVRIAFVIFQFCIIFWMMLFDQIVFKH